MFWICSAIAVGVVLAFFGAIYGLEWLIYGGENDD